MTLLDQIFADTDRPVMLVSSYDSTITYINAAASQWLGKRATQVLGDDFGDVSAEFRLKDREHSAMLRCIENVDAGIQHDQREDGSWWLVSAVPCADPVRPEIFASGHCADTYEQAEAEHKVLVVRAAMAMEHGRIQRLLNAAMTTSSEALRRLDYIAELLAEAGRRPINPANGTSTAL